VNGRRLRRDEKLFVAAILLPAVVHFALFTALPVLFSLVLSFTQWNVLDTPRWKALDNYARLARDPVFWVALRNTILFTLYYVPPMLAASLALALFVNRQTRAASVFKTAYFIPVVTSFVVLAIIFRWVFSADPVSPANVAVTTLGIAPQSWLQDRNQALPLLAFLGIVKGVAWNMVYFLAGLHAIPDTFYEAARIDGAGRWKVFRNVTLPLLRPTVFFVTVLTTIGAFQVFDSAYLLTQGGPARATTTIVYFIYQKGFEDFEMGYASASAYVLLALVLAVTWLQKRWLGKPADWY
jgi:multiple sugar transport system permease protein